METNHLLKNGELNIPCVLTQPEPGPVQRVILGVHGLGGSSRDQIQAGLAEEMALFSAATVRFDFPGHGKNTTPLTLKNCIDSLLEAARYAHGLFPEVEDLCIFATGFGAYVTLVALEQLLELPVKIKLVVQTPSVLMHLTLLTMAQLSEETFWAMEKITFPTDPPLVFTYRFYEELMQHIALVPHPIPMLILQGEEDAYIRDIDIRRFRSINEQAKLVTIPGASHRFMEEGAWDMVLDLTRDWFEFEQVLLTDWE